jgi:hypothetical protein
MLKTLLGKKNTILIIEMLTKEWVMYDKEIITKAINCS